jgi:hypothetical protein
MSAEKIPLLLFGLIALAGLVGCSQKVLQVYAGPRLPTNEISILSAERAAAREDADVVIRRVNGVDTQRNGQPRIEVLPGSQIVHVELFKRGGYDDAYTDSRAYRIVIFDTQPGHSYFLRGRIADGIGNVRVLDETGAETPITSVAPDR